MKKPKLKKVTPAILKEILAFADTEYVEWKINDGQHGVAAGAALTKLNLIQNKLKTLLGIKAK